MTRHRVLSLQECDDLIKRQDTILGNSALIAYVLDSQRRKSPGDDSDYAMLTAVREKLAALAHEIQTAATDSMAIIHEAPKRDDVPVLDLYALLSEIFPDDRRATFADITSLLQRVKQALDAAQMPAADQRQYVEEVLDLGTVLLDRAVFDAEQPGTPPTPEVDAIEIVQQWLAVYWPEGEEPEAEKGGQ